MVLSSFPDWDEFLQCHIRDFGCITVVVGVVAVKLECRALGDGVVLYLPEQAFYV